MRSTSSLLLVCLGLGATVAACDPPNEDTFRMNGGAAPDPTGVIQGTVLYVGPRPSCVYNEAGGVSEITGSVILTLFRFDNPPPPAGSATSAVSLLTVPGESLFASTDCMPQEPTTEDERTIMRSAPFTWPELALGHGACRDVDGAQSCPGQSYQVRGFYDSDADFNPFFGVRNLPTAGDIGGGAFIDISVSPPQPLEIQFGHVTQETNGQIVSGVAVTLGAVVNTERPIFEVVQANALGSSERIPAVADPIERERLLFEMTNMRLTTIVSAAQPTPSEAWLRALTAGGIDSTNYRFGVPEYGLYITNVDANSDGMPDGHPILGTAGILYFTPVIIAKRVRNPIETRLGLPEIVTVGSIKPTVQRGLPFLIPRQNMMEFDAVIAPIAVMITNPAMPALCRAPIIPPGNALETLERIWNDCQDFPTGNYDVNILNGIAGGEAVHVRDWCVSDCITPPPASGRPPGDPVACNMQCDFTSPLISDNGWRFQGGQYSSQAWSIPNDLGCPDVQYRPTAVNQLDDVGADGVTLPECGAEGSAMLPIQSRQAGWSVVDDGEPFAVDQAIAATTPGHGIMACNMASPAAGGAAQPVDFMPPPTEECCPPALDQFCGLPLCALRDASVAVPADPAAGFVAPRFPADSTYAYPEAVRAHSGGSRLTREIRVEGEDYVNNADGTITPLCTPFLMPVACCQLAETR